jgi:hypothetical protein
MNPLFRAAGFAAASAVLAFSTIASAAAQQPKGPVVSGPAPSGISGWAAIKADGTFARRLNAGHASKLSTGEYEVIFNSKINKCAYTATTGDPGSSEVPGPFFIGITGRSGNGKAVFVTTYDQNGLPADRAFFVNVTC